MVSASVENFLGLFPANGFLFRSFKIVKTLREQIKGMADNSAVDVDTAVVFLNMKKLAHVLRIRATEMSEESPGVLQIADRAAQVRATAARGLGGPGLGR